MLNAISKTFLLISSTSLLVGACGDDDGSAQFDATVVEFDAAPAPDAAPPDPTFTGTLSLAEISVSNPEGVALGVSGAVASIGFTDPADVVIAPQPGYTNNIGACRIFVYGDGESAPKGSEAGPISITGTNAGPFNCAYNAAADAYLCSSTDAGAAGAVPMATTTLTPNGNGTATLIIGGADFSGTSYVGMSISLKDFVDADANGVFPIVAQLAANTLVIVNADLTGATAPSADTTYATLVGAGPIPGGYDFLDDGTNDVVFTKAAITNAPAISTTLNANGEGFALAASSTLPHALPTDGTTPATFSCAGSCGSVATDGHLKGIIVFGETTDADLTGTDFNDMPEPVTSFATFQCSGINAESITLDAGAIALIMGTNPTRIQTSVTYANAVAGKNNILLSHGVVGFTTVEP